jgi:hypothetical protein
MGRAFSPHFCGGIYMGLRPMLVWSAPLALWSRALFEAVAPCFEAVPLRKTEFLIIL